MTMTYAMSHSGAARCFPRFAALVFMAVTLLVSAGPVTADRHCMPAQQAFFGARHALQSDDATCAARMSDAMESLEGAVAFADVCGCPEMAESVQALIDEVGADGMSCEKSVERVLGFSERMEELIQFCH